MFMPIYMLPYRDIDEWKKYENRWNENEEIYNKVVELIKSGAGEDFLQSDYENGRLPILEDMWDLKGINFHGLDINFPDGDNFEAINFKFAEFWNCNFTNATFPSTHFTFARFYNVTFKKCIFALGAFHGTKLENVTFEDCDFIEHSGFTNCEFANTKFIKTFFNDNIFHDCKFDNKITIDINLSCTRWGSPKAQMNMTNLSGLYTGIKESFENGKEYDLSREYYYQQLVAFRQYNITSKLRKVLSWLLDIISGYGVKPQRSLLCSLAVLSIFTIIFFFNLGFNDGLLLSTGSFFTFGAKTDRLNDLPAFFKILYVLESFLASHLMRFL
jgi:uncharacterized protein YjbI with pentapeptide repeats